MSPSRGLALAVAGLSLMALIASMLCVFLTPAGVLLAPPEDPLPTDHLLVAWFREHRVELEVLVAAVRSDADADQVDGMRRRLGVQSCTGAVGERRTVWLQLASHIGYFEGGAKGLAWSLDRLAPLTTDLDEERGDSSQDRTRWYRHLDGPWYLYAERLPGL